MGSASWGSEVDRSAHDGHVEDDAAAPKDGPHHTQSITKVPSQRRSVLVLVPYHVISTLTVPLEYGASLEKSRLSKSMILPAMYGPLSVTVQ